MNDIHLWYIYPSAALVSIETTFDNSWIILNQNSLINFFSFNRLNFNMKRKILILIILFKKQKSIFTLF
jgi:hypothetical protein